MFFQSIFLKIRNRIYLLSLFAQFSSAQFICSVYQHFLKIRNRIYLLSLRERKLTRIKAPRVQSKFEPQVGDVVLIKQP